MSAEPCRFGTNDCDREPLALVTVTYSPAVTGSARPMCQEHVTILVEAVMLHDDELRLTVAPLPRLDLDDG